LPDCLDVTDPDKTKTLKTNGYHAWGNDKVCTDDTKRQNDPCPGTDVKLN